jgi:hypothetical protein
MKHASLTLACLACLASLAHLLSAASIQFVGLESGVAVQNWSNPTELKMHDINGDDRYGVAGYYQIMPAPIETTDSIVLSAESGNDLGVSLDPSDAAPALKTDSFRPGFLSGPPAGGAGEFINTPNFPIYSDALGNSQLRQGSIWLYDPLNQGTMRGGATGYFNTAFSFTLNKAAAFRLGVVVDTMSFDGAAPDYVSISKVGSGNVFSDPINRNGVSDMVFFDIIGGEGDVFVVKLWQADANRTAFALITFDQLAVSAPPTLSYTQADGNIILSWQQNITGWILESSTDLGITDGWDPVPGVSNNTAIVPMAGVPKNYFRLKKSP